MTAPTQRPSAPDACGCSDDVYPRCGHDVGAPLAAEVPTVPAPGPCQERALAALLLDRVALERRIADATRGLDDAAIGRAVRAFEAERDRVFALRTASRLGDCGGDV